MFIAEEVLLFQRALEIDPMRSFCPSQQQNKASSQPGSVQGGWEGKQDDPQGRAELLVTLWGFPGAFMKETYEIPSRRR